MNKDKWVIQEKDGELKIVKWEKPYPPLMKCGHTAQGEKQKGKKFDKDLLCCVICAGLEKEGMIAETTQPDLSGRVAKCAYKSCQSKQPSSFNLAFFKYRPGEEHDEYYCGCYGWD